jgi:two-component system, NtrC family, nitrogen regulation response regulator NtrX
LPLIKAFAAELVGAAAPVTVTPEGQAALRAHPFPGNVRELRNLVERLVILTPDRTIDIDAVEQCMPRPNATRSGGLELRGTLRDTLEEVERHIVRTTLERHSWRMTEVATQLGLERSHLYKKMKALGIAKPE